MSLCRRYCLAYIPHAEVTATRGVERGGHPYIQALKLQGVGS